MDSLLQKIQRLEDELDEARAELIAALARRDQAIENGEWWRQQADETREQVRRMQVEIERRDLALRNGREEIERLAAELERSRRWQVARRDYGLKCTSCDGPIVRGQAVEPAAGAPGWYQHCACPDREAS